MALIDKLTDIADAIREKTGTTDKLTLEAMPTAITAIETGGSDPVIESLEITSNGTYTATDCDGYSPITVNVPQDGAPTDEELTFTGNCTYRFANNGWNWVIDKYGNRITTKDITNGSYMFSYTNIEQIPFDINIKDVADLQSMFNSAEKLTTPPKVRGTIKWSTSTKLNHLLKGCYKLRDMEDVFTPEMIEGFSTFKVTGSYSTPNLSNMLEWCSSLRTIPSWWYKFKLNPESTAIPYYPYSLFYYGLSNCSSLDEATNIPVWSCAGAQTSNMFTSTFAECHRLKNVTFETNPDGTPVEANWKSQIIDLSSFIGYYYTGQSVSSFSDVVQRESFVKLYCYNSGITADKLIYNDETYQLLKDDPDSHAIDCGGNSKGGLYSRYNHDSAVNTINSLPDTSAYLATAGGTNTIKFKGAAGSKTDGGAINTLTAEEIAVATAKGWTVTLS